jgi:hypothetical protein
MHTRTLIHTLTHEFTRQIDAKLPPSPWRITFDTNVSDCNLNCVMCEGFRFAFKFLMHVDKRSAIAHSYKQARTLAVSIVSPKSSRRRSARRIDD